MKDGFIKIRISKQKKLKWQKASKNLNISLSSFIESSCDKKLTQTEKLEVMKFIEMQGNIFKKIENNVNQIAKYVNAKKSIANPAILEFNHYLSEIEKLKKEQNQIILNVLRKLK